MVTNAVQKERMQTLNDEDRRQWVENDEGLYRLFLSSRLSMRQYIRTNRIDIDTVIRNVTSGARPQHYLAYKR